MALTCWGTPSWDRISFLLGRSQVVLQWSQCSCETKSWLARRGPPKVTQMKHPEQCWQNEGQWGKGIEKTIWPLARSSWPRGLVFSIRENQMGQWVDVSKTKRSTSAMPKRTLMLCTSSGWSHHSPDLAGSTWEGPRTTRGWDVPAQTWKLLSALVSLNHLLQHLLSICAKEILKNNLSDFAFFLGGIPFSLHCTMPGLDRLGWSYLLWEEDACLIPLDTSRRPVKQPSLRWAWGCNSCTVLQGLSLEYLRPRQEGQPSCSSLDLRGTIWGTVMGIDSSDNTRWYSQIKSYWVRALGWLC